MYYSIILGMISATDPKDESTKGKLRCNLWLALNDARLLLEPSEPNIQALIVLAVDVEEFTKPSLCWMLVTNACRMLQALGVNHRRFDPQTRERRVIMFWHLNLVDIGLALIFGRPPTFHRGMAREIPLPTLDQLLPFQPHLTATGAPAVFGARKSVFERDAVKWKPDIHDDLKRTKADRSFRLHPPNVSAIAYNDGHLELSSRRDNA